MGKKLSGELKGLRFVTLEGQDFSMDGRGTILSFLSLSLWIWSWFCYRETYEVHYSSFVFVVGRHIF